MDLTTIIGLLMGAGLVAASISESLDSFLDAPSMFIVIGGGTGAVLMSVTLKSASGLPKVVLKAFLSGKESLGPLIEEMVRYGEIARRDGILALEGVMNDISDPFLGRGIQLAVDGNDPEEIDETLSREMDSLSDRHAKGKKLFDLLGKYMPAFGMIGTLIGLILMLANLEDPSQIAPNMAVALLTTLYGAILANLIALPIADKLEARSELELMRMNIVREGVISIQSGDNPKVVEQKLQLYLPPTEKVRRMSKRERKKAPVVEGAPEWMVTFGDLMSLLLTFFILLFSISEVKSQKIYELVKSFKTHWQISAPVMGFHIEQFSEVIHLLSSPSLELPDQKEGNKGKTKVQVENPFGEHAEVERIDNNLLINLSGKVMFEEHSAELLPEGRDKLDLVRERLRGHGNWIRIIGHANPTVLPPNSQFADHDYLALARSKAVKDYLAADGRDGTPGVRDERMEISSRGKNDRIPGVSLLDRDQRRKLDRVEIMVTPERAIHQAPR